MKRKAERYPSASELLVDLQAFLVPSEERRDDACPYRGLAAFGERDAKYFFGRADETRTAIAQLDRWPLLAVVGPSGVGKSSFVHAGVVPALRATGGDWQVHVLRPGRAPLQRLAALIDDGLANRLADEPGVFGVALRGRHGKTLIVVDQLEELFTICDDARVRDVFLRALLAAADDPGSPVRVVLAMRADFLDRVAAHGALVPELTRGLFFLTAPDPAVLREALERPAELAGYAFEDRGIVDDMLQAATGRGALPLLAFAASRLWDARDRERKLLTVSAYRAIGGVGGAFALHADRVASAVPPRSQPLLRAIVTRLVTPDGTRAVVERADLRSLSTDPREVDLILDQLVHARLIHAETDGDVELVHEILITEWPTLRQWLDDSLAMRAFTHELGQAAKQWHAHGRPDDLVWRGATAHDALGIAKRHVLDLASTERDFLAAIDKQLARGRRRRFFAFASIVGVLGLGLAGASVAAVRIKLAETEAQDKAQQAEMARREVEQANAKLQAQIDAVAEANRQAQAAEDEKRAADEQRRKAEAETKQSMAQNAETKRRADAERLRANRSTEKLKATQQELDATQSAQRAKDDERRRKAQQKGIVVDDLLGKPKAEP
jgi:hypothetical protein